MTDSTVYRQRLESEKARLEEDLRRIDERLSSTADDLDPNRGGVANHPADDGNETFEAAKEIGLRVNIQQMLDEVNRAMERVEAGTYGVCANCGKPIPEERLEARPFATLCVHCQQEQEQQRPSSVSVP